MLFVTMDYKILIQQKLPEYLQKLALEYKIPVKYLQDDVALVVLVLESKSLSQKEEKQNWFDLMEMMDETQVEKLRDILIREKQKIQEIEEKYEEKKKEIKAKYKTRYDMYVNNNRVKQMKAVENQQREQELEDADALLDNL